MALALAAVGLTACGGGDGGDDGPASLARPGTTEPPTFAAPATTTTAVPAVVEITPPPGNGAASASPTTTPASPATTASPRVAAAPPLTPAPPGTYRYATTGVTQFNVSTTAFPPITTLVVDPPTGTRQHAARDLRDAARNGPVFESVLDYRPDGVYLVELKVSTTVVLVTDVQQVRPPSPVLFLPTGADPGYRNRFEHEGIAVAIEVVGTEPVTIGSRRHDTTVVRVTADALGEGNARMELTVWLDPSTRLWVTERSSASAGSPDGGGFTFRSEYDATLLP